MPGPLGTRLGQAQLGRAALRGGGSWHGAAVRRLIISEPAVWPDHSSSLPDSSGAAARLRRLNPCAPRSAPASLLAWGAARRGSDRGQLLSAAASSPAAAELPPAMSSGGVLFGRDAWDPVTIVAQIVGLQCLYYLSLGLLFKLIVGEPV